MLGKLTVLTCVFGFLTNCCVFGQGAKTRIRHEDSLQRYTSVEILKQWDKAIKSHNDQNAKGWRNLREVLDKNTPITPIDPALVTSTMAANDLRTEHDQIYKPMARYKIAKQRIPLLQDSLEALFVDSLIARLSPSDAQLLFNIGAAARIKASLRSRLVPLHETGETNPVRKTPTEDSGALASPTNEQRSLYDRILKKIYADKFNWPFALLLVSVLGFTGWLIRRYMRPLITQKDDDKEIAHPGISRSPNASYHEIVPTSDTRLSESNTSPPVAATPDEKLPADQPQLTIEPQPLSQPVQTVRPTVKQEVFYMTVPGANGTFSLGAKKSTSAGCLYKFVVNAKIPEKADISFCGSSSEMGNAQAFRDIELLPACEFIGLPNVHTFDFTQKDGEANFDGTVWRVQKKIQITFLP